MLNLFQHPKVLCSKIIFLSPPAMERCDHDEASAGKKQMLSQAQHDVQSDRRVQVKPADVFGIYGRSARRINHVGLVKEHREITWSR